MKVWSKGKADTDHVPCRMEMWLHTVTRDLHPRSQRGSFSVFNASALDTSAVFSLSELIIQIAASIHVQHGFRRALSTVS